MDSGVIFTSTGALVAGAGAAKAIGGFVNPPGIPNTTGAFAAA